MPNFISEDDIEQALLEQLKTKFKFELLNCYTKKADDLNDRSNRQSKKDVIFRDRLTAACYKLNPNIPQAEIDKVIEEVCKRRTVMSAVMAIEDTGMGISPINF